MPDENYEEEAVCDLCGATGSWEFEGGNICPECADKIIDEQFEKGE